MSEREELLKDKLKKFGFTNALRSFEKLQADSKMYECDTCVKGNWYCQNKCPLRPPKYSPVIGKQSENKK
jgi:hypothetical protein